MDRQTLEFYDRTAAETAAKYRTVNQRAWRQQFQEAFPAGGRVLDVGAGSGHDLALLLELGFDAYGTEPSPRMREQHERRFDHELVNLAGVRMTGNWQNAAFGRLIEAVEVTAMQRGAERWRPQ